MAQCQLSTACTLSDHSISPIELLSGQLYSVLANCLQAGKFIIHYVLAHLTGLHLRRCSADSADQSPCVSNATGVQQFTQGPFGLSALGIEGVCAELYEDMLKCFSSGRLPVNISALARPTQVTPGVPGASHR